MSIPVLYIFMRTDLESLNPGKAMAQAAHAANQMSKHMLNVENRGKKKGGGCMLIAYFHSWEKEAKGFGTTLVMDGKNLEYLPDVLSDVCDECDAAYGLVHDPTYPIVDGEVVWTLPVDTCLWLFGDKEELAPHLTEFKLHE